MIRHFINRYRNNKVWEKEAQAQFPGMNKVDRTKWRPLTETPMDGIGGVWGDNLALVYKRNDGKFYLLAIRADLPPVEANITKWRYSNY